LSALPAPEFVSAVLPSGELLMWDRFRQTPLPALRLVDPETGRQTRPLALHLAPNSDALRAGEHATQPIIEPCGCAVTLVVQDSKHAAARALVKVDLRSAELTTRIDLPQGSEQGMSVGVWVAHAQPAEGLVLTHTYRAGTEIELLDDVTGERRAVTRLPYGTSIVARGEAVQPN